MRFEFKLQKVLEHRKQLENMAQVDFQEELYRLNQFKFELVELENNRSTAFNAFDTSRPQETKTLLQTVNNALDFIKGQDIKIENQKIKVQEQEKLVESKREILREKSIQFKIIDKLKERKVEEFVREENKREQKVIDDLVTIRFDLKEKE